MKKLILTQIILMMWGIVYAQETYPKFEISIDGGSSIALGSFSNADNSSNAGFAMAGWKYGVSSGWFVSENVSIILKTASVINAINAVEFSRVYTSTLKNQLNYSGVNISGLDFTPTTNESSWNYNTILIGTSYKWIFDKWDISIYGSSGYALVNSPNIYYNTKITNILNGDPSDFYIVSPSASSNSFCFALGSKFSYSLSKSFSINSGFEYQKMNADFHTTQTVSFYVYSTINNNYTGSLTENSSSSDFSQPISALNATLGIVFKFGSSKTKKDIPPTNQVILEDQTKTVSPDENVSLKEKRNVETQVEPSNNKKPEEINKNSEIGINKPIKQTISEKLIQEKKSEDNLYFINTNIVNLRGGMGKNFPIVEKISLGEIVEVIDKSNSEWWRVIYKDKTGYVSSNFLSLKK